MCFMSNCIKYIVFFHLLNVHSKYFCATMREHINLTNLFLFRNICRGKVIMLRGQRLIWGNGELEWKTCFSIYRANTFNSSKDTSKNWIFYQFLNTQANFIVHISHRIYYGWIISIFTYLFDSIKKLLTPKMVLKRSPAGQVNLLKWPFKHQNIFEQLSGSL